MIEQLNWTEFLKSLYGLYDQPIDSIVNRDENILLYDVNKFKKILELLKNTSAQVFSKWLERKIGLIDFIWILYIQITSLNYVLCTDIIKIVSFSNVVDCNRHSYPPKLYTIWRILWNTSDLFSNILTWQQVKLLISTLTRTTLSIIFLIPNQLHTTDIYCKNELIN